MTAGILRRGAGLDGGRRGARPLPRAVLAAVVGLLLASPARAADFTLTPSGSLSLITEPRGVLTVSVRVENREDSALDLMARLVLPVGWKRMGNEMTFSLGPGEGDTRIVSFLVSQGTRPGIYELPFFVERNDGSGVKESVTFTVIVSPRWKIDVRLLSAPELALAGEEYKAVYSVLNASNADAVVLLDVAPGGGFPCSLDVDRLELASGASREVTVTVHTPPQLPSQVTNVVTLKARVEQADAVRAEATSALVAIPRVQPVGDAYWNLPLVASLSSGYKSSGSEALWGIRPVLSADGPLDEEGTKRVSLLLRPAAFPDASSIADLDEYRLGFQTDAFSLVLGDAERILSPLLAPSLWGRGAEARAGIAFLEAAGFYVQPVGGDSSNGRTGVRLDAVLSGDNRVGLNWLQTPDGDAVSAVAKLAGPVKLQAEYGMAAGRSADGAMGPDAALLVDLLSARSGPSWSLKYLHAGPYFPGAYRDLDVYSAAANVPLGRGLTAMASLRQETHNLEKEAARGTAPQEAIATFGMDGKLGSGISLAVSWRSQDKRDLLPTPGFYSHSDTVRMDLGKTLQKANLGVGAEMSRTDDLHGAKTLLSEKYSATVEVVPATGRSVKGSLSYDVGGRLIDVRTSTFTALIAASLNLTASTAFTAQVQWTEDPLAFQSGTAVGKATLSHVFPGKETVSAQAGLTVAADPRVDKEMFLQIDCRIPLSLPVARRKSIGTVRGRVFDAESGAAIMGALLRIEGFTAVSDENGAFRFPALKPGSYYLNLDMGRLGYDRISTNPLPMPVTVKGAGETFTELGITRKASLNGTVVVQGVGGLGHVVVELAGGGELKRTYTDATGRFSFPELRPGEWVLTLPAREMPEYSDMDRNHVVLSLSAGQKAEASLNVIPRKRSIQMIEEGTVQEESKP